RDYRNEFDPDDWMGPREYVAIEPSPVRSPLSIPGFEFLLAILGVVAAIYLIKWKGIRLTFCVFAKCPSEARHLGEGAKHRSRKHAVSRSKEAIDQTSSNTTRSFLPN
ncbi:MAG: PGF-CTERM sorting domain-containing protein, partial [Halobacteriota archaeon]